MKKVLLLTAFAAMAMGVFAQAPLILNDNFKPFKADETNIEQLKKGTPAGFRKSVSDWYDFAEYLANNAPSGSDLRNYASFLFPDSTVRFVSRNSSTQQNEAFYWGEHSTGFTWDVKDDLWSTAGFDNFANKDSYTVDSIAFFYIYRRNNSNQNVVDTVYLDVYQNAALNRGGFQQLVGVYARPVIDYNLVSGQNRAIRRTILLGIEDTTNFSGNGWGFGIHTEPIGLNVAGNAAQNTNIFSFTLTFKPGHSFNLGDTMEVPFGDPRPENGVNYYGYRLNRNEGPENAQIRNTYFNHSNVLIKELRYPGTTLPNSNWSGYIPGNAYNSIRYMTNFAHITGNSSVSVKELNQYGAALGKAYPNPARSGGSMNIEMGITKNTEVTIELVNLLGKVIESKTMNMDAGEHTVTLNLKNAKPGIYMYTLRTADYSTSRKVTIVE